MDSYPTLLPTTYNIFRCALAYGQAYLPACSSMVTKIAAFSLFTCDVVHTGYVGWQVKKHLKALEPQNSLKGGRFKGNPPPSVQQQKQLNAESVLQFHTDLVLKSVALGAVALLFVKVINKVLVPKVNPMDLVQEANFFKARLQQGAGKPLDPFTVTWAKTFLENCITVLFFTRTALDLYLGYLTSKRLSFFNALVNGSILLKSCPYRTWEVKHCFLNLFDPVKTPIKQVEAIFYLNTEGMSQQAILEKVQSIYSYSVTIFKRAVWQTSSLDFLDRSGPKILTYKAVIQGSPPPAPLTVRLFHQEMRWKPFVLLDPLQWIPRFYEGGHPLLFSSWFKVDLEVPQPALDRLIRLFKDFLLLFL